MKFSFRLVVILVFSLVLSIGGFLCWDNMESRILKEQLRDLRVQLAESRQQADTFYIRDSIPVWNDRIVEVDRTDYKRLLADRELIKELKLKVAQVEAENRLLTGVRDTVYLEPSKYDGVRDSGKVLRYHDEWADFAYFEEKRRLEYSVRDSLTTFVTRDYRHRFLWWRWGTKGYSVYHVNYNPNSRIYYNKYIRVKR